ncbi:unnamed protein product [Brachionus calyciflorus]|uniref:Uncharacterized protein n=1 Tax=Brachionus calyciflorus TaxID=104777 RepID=A0A813MWL1_9BILA|nr:unnamed protein product [Brachionus calyciflorus]
MKSISSIAANRYLNKRQCNAYYCSASYLKAYESFAFKSHISYSSFFKYIDEKFKKPHRISDLCDYCEKNKDYKKELLMYAQENCYESDDFTKIKEFLIKIKSGFLRNQDAFKQIDQNKYIVWADTGTHFRCAEVLHYFFQELPQEGIKVCLKFFVEKHGKNSRDQHFLAVSNFIKQESMVKKISCSQDIVDAIHKNQDSANIKRKDLKLDPIVTYAYVVENGIEKNQVKFFRKVQNVRIYYNFFSTDSSVLKSVILSDLTISKTVEYVDTSSSNYSDKILENEEIKVKEEKHPNIVKKN